MDRILCLYLFSVIKVKQKTTSFVWFFLETPNEYEILCLHGSGPRGIRTPDLLNAIETRSQLRYGPGTIFDFEFQIYELQSSIENLKS
jgi:hypothetical protein